jgi:CheY-like chemotaxis protein
MDSYELNMIDKVTPQPLKVLIVEDTPERQEVLTALYRAHAWILVNTSHRAITLLHAYDFDMISLDYNLRGEFNGDEVAQALINSRNKDCLVIIHSMNPKGAEKIAGLLPNAINYPVSKMIRSNKVFKTLQQKITDEGINFDWKI